MATRAFLLCGDEKAVHVVSQILDELEVSFEHSSEPAFSLKRLAAQKFDLLIVDCDNVQNATQVFNSARASNLNKNSIAIAIVEGKAGVPNAFRLGASLVLTKPVSLEQTRNTLRTGVGMTRKEAPEVKAPASTSATAVPVTPAVPGPAIKPAAAPTVSAAPAVRIASTAPPTVAAPVVASDATPKSSVSAPPMQAKPAPLVPRPVSPAPESKPVPPVVAEPKPAPVSASPTMAKAAAAAAASAKSNFDSIFTSSAVVEEPSSAKKGTKRTEDAELKKALESPLKISASPVDEDGNDLDPDDDFGVPSFGGMCKQPFAGIEEASEGKSGRGALIAVLVLVVLGGSAYGAWATQPSFQKFLSWEYLNLASKVAAIRGQAPTSAPTQVAQAPVAPAPAMTAPVAEANPPAADSNPNAGPSGAAGSTAPATNATSSNGPQPATPAAADGTAPSGPALQAAKQDTNTGSNPALVAASASVPGPSAKTTSSDLLEVPEDFADDQVVHRVHPAYPKQARARKLHGTVVLETVVSKQGKVDSLQLVSGDPVLAQAAADAVKQWRYKPYMHNGEYIEFQTRVTVEFKEPQLLKTAR